MTWRFVVRAEAVWLAHGDSPVVSAFHAEQDVHCGPGALPLMLQPLDTVRVRADPMVDMVALWHHMPAHNNPFVKVL